MSVEVHFIADAMLGRLARWLRLLGFDTLYYRDIKDSDLLKRALREGRVILTKDTHFLRMKNLENVCFVHAEKPVAQLREVCGAFNLTSSGIARCGSCNGVLHEITGKERLRDRVPDYVFLSARAFTVCSSCGKVYWEGTHLRRFRELLASK
ncbi:MAG TPA: Mut7-C RNAse domain-containing protein [Thermodesulfovibrionales bacterium]|nr:Mut7-C RNAse domain-containing protein [Thermodesulfovibrionales bacterium]